MQRRGFLTALAALVVGPRPPVASVPGARVAGPSLQALELGAEGARRAIQSAIGRPALSHDELSVYVAAVIQLKNLGRSAPR